MRRVVGVSAAPGVRRETHPPGTSKRTPWNMSTEMTSRSTPGLDIVRLFGWQLEPPIFDPRRHSAAAKLRSTRRYCCDVALGWPPTSARGGLAAMAICGRVAVKCPDLSALCPIPRECGDRPAACLKHRDVIPNNETQPPCNRARSGPTCSFPLTSCPFSQNQRHNGGRACKA